MAAMLMFENNETEAMLVYKGNPLGVEFISYVNTFFCSNKLAQMLALWVKTLYIGHFCLLLSLYFLQRTRKKKKLP